MSERRFCRCCCWCSLRRLQRSGKLEQISGHGKKNGNHANGWEACLCKWFVNKKQAGKQSRASNWYFKATDWKWKSGKFREWIKGGDKIKSWNMLVFLLQHRELSVVKSTNWGWRTNKFLHFTNEAANERQTSLSGIAELNCSI